MCHQLDTVCESIEDLMAISIGMGRRGNDAMLLEDREESVRAGKLNSE